MDYKFPVYATQGGGLVRQIYNKLIFVEKPDCPGFTVGDEMPQEWGITPANQQAMNEMEVENSSFEKKEKKAKKTPEPRKEKEIAEYGDIEELRKRTKGMSLILMAKTFKEEFEMSLRDAVDLAHKLYFENKDKDNA